MARFGSLSYARHTTASRHRFAVWLAVLALFMQVAVPFGQALAFDPDTDIEYQVICTASGVKQIPVNPDGTPFEAQDVRSCPFCFAHTATAVLPQADLGPATYVYIGHVETTFAHQAHTQHTSVWRATPRPSRAPPLSI